MAKYPQMAPKWLPKWSQNRSKIDQKSIQNGILKTMWKVYQKASKNEASEPPKSFKNVVTSFNFVFWPCHKNAAKMYQKMTQNRPQNHQNCFRNRCQKLLAKRIKKIYQKTPKWLENGVPKGRPRGSDESLVRHFLASWGPDGPQTLPKSSPGAPKTLQTRILMILGGFSIKFWWILGLFSADLWFLCTYIFIDFYIYIYL